MTELLNAASLSSWAGSVADATVASGVVLLAVLAADLALSRRVSARWRAALYLAVLVRLLLPAQWTSPAGLLRREAPPVAAAVTAAPALDAVPAATAVRVAAPPAPRTALALQLGVTALLVLTWVACRVRFGRALAGVREASPRLRELAPGLPVVEHATCGPAVFGLLRPRIVVPSPLLRALDDDALRAVLRHEAAHLQRRDPWLLAFLQVGTFAFWPLLPAWIAAWRVRGLMEQACDEAALRSAGPVERRAYGEALLAVAEWQPARARLALGMLRFGGGLAPRLRALRETRRWPALAQAACVVAAVAAVVLLAGERPARADEPAPPEAADVLRERAQQRAREGDAVGERFLLEGIAEIATPKRPRDPAVKAERITEGLTPPSLVTNASPVVDEATRRRLAGTGRHEVALEAVIDESGRPTWPRILKSDDEGLSAASLLALEQFRYEPARRDGVAVPVYLVVAMRFAPFEAPDDMSLQAILARLAVREISVNDGSAGEKLVSGVVSHPDQMMDVLRELESAGWKPLSSAVSKADGGVRFGLRVQPRLFLANIIAARIGATELGSLLPDITIQPVVTVSRLSPDFAARAEEQLESWRVEGKAWIAPRQTIVVNWGEEARLASTGPDGRPVFNTRVTARLDASRDLVVDLVATIQGTDLTAHGSLPMAVVVGSGDDALLVVVSGQEVTP